MIRRPPRSTLSSSSAASDVYKRQYQRRVRGRTAAVMLRCRAISRSASSLTRFPALSGPERVEGKGSIEHMMQHGGVTHPTKYMSSLYKEHGKIFTVDLSTSQNEWVVVCDPVHWAQILASEGEFPHGGLAKMTVHQKFLDRHPERVVPGLMKVGPEWKEARRAIAPAITNLQAANSFYPLLDNAVELASSNLPSTFEGHGAYDQHKFWNYWSRTSLDMFTSVMLGLDAQLTRSDVSEYEIERVRDCQRTIELMLTSLVQPWRAEEIYPEYEQVVKKSLGFVEALVDEAMEGPHPVKPNTVLAKILEQGRMKEDVVASIHFLLTGAVDTVAGLSSWFLVNMARFPHKQDILHEELTRVLRGGHPTEETVKQMPYLRAVYREAFRYSNTNLAISRKQLPHPISFGGHDFPAETTFALASHPIQNDPEFVDDPAVFMPERFLPEAKKARKGTPAGVIDQVWASGPFAGGKRMCIGARTAKVEILHLMSRVFQDYRVTMEEPVSPTDQYAFAQSGTTVSVPDPFPKLLFERRR
eukprot:TRINITY_DN6821_c0_g6_i1.p1 TRINITY_DN6821_c0_g6~~TRINITY_DN6821_c0_g6_i1.p1  ORF type:complete len:530 (+),score=122.10 TRINITY_DN6821_c0_g6_i1:78-1667(+)